MVETREEWYFEIISQLDNAAQEYKFPAFDNVNYPAADMRLTAFRDDSEWLILFEKLVFSRAESAFLSMIHAFGNKILSPGLQSNSAYEVITATPGCPLWDNEMNFLIDLFNITLRIKGEVRTFEVTPDDYREAHVNLKDNSPPEFKVLCLLVNLMKGQLFRSDNDLLRACNRSNLEKVVQLDDWHHPDVYNNVLPSKCDFFQKFAQSISDGSYKVHDYSGGINSYWYYWEYFW